MSANVTVKRNEAEPEPVEIIAQSIIDITASMKRIDASRLSRRALVALIYDESKLPKRDINVVLNNLGALESIWLKKGGTK